MISDVYVLGGRKEFCRVVNYSWRLPNPKLGYSAEMQWLWKKGMAINGSGSKIPGTQKHLGLARGNVSPKPAALRFTFWAKAKWWRIGRFSVSRPSVVAQVSSSMNSGRVRGLGWAKQFIDRCSLGVGLAITWISALFWLVWLDVDLNLLLLGLRMALEEALPLAVCTDFTRRTPAWASCHKMREASPSVTTRPCSENKWPWARGILLLEHCWEIGWCQVVALLCIRMHFRGWNTWRRALLLRKVLFIFGEPLQIACPHWLPPVFAAGKVEHHFWEQGPLSRHCAICCDWSEMVQPGNCQPGLAAGS